MRDKDRKQVSEQTVRETQAKRMNEDGQRVRVLLFIYFAPSLIIPTKRHIDSCVQGVVLTASVFYITVTVTQWVRCLLVSF